MPNENTQAEVTQQSGGAAAVAAAGAATTQQQPAGQGAATGTAGIPWLNGASTEEIAFAQSKGWGNEVNAPTDQIFRSYHNLQKLFGADKAGNTIMVPGETADEETWNKVYSRLGRPEKADGYTAKPFAGMDEEQFNKLREVAHKHGLSEKQFNAIKEWNDSAATEFDGKLKQAAQAEFATQEATLKRDWGAAYDQNLQAGKVAVSQLGITAEQVDALQMSLGFDGVMKLMAKIGSSLGEGTFHVGDKGRAGGTQNNVMAPEQAKTELGRLMNDKDFKEAWMDKMHPRHKEMIDRKSQLSRWAAGEK